MARSEFEIEQMRLQAARSLPSRCFEDFQRLSRTLLHGPEFQWLLVDAPHEGLRNQVIAALDPVLAAAGRSVNTLPLSGRIEDVAALESRLVNNAGRAQVVHVIGRRGWFDARRWEAFNARRERIAASARARLVFWLDAEAIELAARGAPDLWAWRGGVYAFLPEGQQDAAAASEQRLARSSRPDGLTDTRTMASRYRRMAEIREWLREHPSAADDLQVAPVDELGRLLKDAGEYDEALALWRAVEIPLHRRRGDERAVAVTQGQISDVLQARGQLEEALRIRREEQLPVFGRLGDLHALAVTQGQIADILCDSGQLDEALRIYREKVLPVFERFGDARSRAATHGRIADVLQARGQLDEALRLHREEELPVFEELGDVHALAATQRQIAGVLYARGQFDEALRIYREEVLPVFERLGDLRARAVTLGDIADVLQARGQGDEALRIRREEQLPAIEQLGDSRSRAMAQWKIAQQLLDQQPPQRQQAQALFELAHATLKGMHLPQAEELALQMQAHGLQPPASAAPAAALAPAD